ncbi:MAG: 2-oxoacid:acceptor oxidoreductase family protein [Chloroflexota bacterium]
METSIIISGFGGQGTLFAGQVIAYAAMDSGKEVTWIPSYGPEMRGGTANCTVIIADEPIGSPLIGNPDMVIALNLPSLDKYEDLISPGGVMVANASLINRRMDREDLRAVYIPAAKIAEELGNPRLANMVLVGALMTINPVLPLKSVKQALADHLPERHKDTLPINFEAMEKGAAFASEAMAEAAS